MPEDLIVTTVYVCQDGPYIVTGTFSLEARAAPRDDASVVLCRCGRSLNKPYCDGTHTRIGFRDDGAAAHVAQPGAGSGATRLTIVPLPNGPLKCIGGLMVSGADGRTEATHDIELCRCGASATKPYCDKSHTQIGFIG